MKITFERVVTGVLALAALGVGASAVRNSFFPAGRGGGPNAPSAAVGPQYEYISQWRDAIPLGIASGNPDALVTVLTFADFECPACAAFHGNLRQVQREFPGTISTVHAHLPLSYHKFAMPAASVLSPK